VSMFRDDVRAAMVAIILTLGVFALLASLSGCGPSAKQVQIAYQRAADACVVEAHQLESACPSGDACIARLHELRARCDAELARICDNRSGRRVCP
jgi:hypothetical protein